MALQPNNKSTGAFVVFFNIRTQEIKPTTQATTRAILSQTLLYGRTRIEIPMKATLLTAEIAEKVLTEKTKRNQKPQGYYDQTAKDLNKVMPGNTATVKPKGLLKAQGWKKGTALQNCGYRSYDVDVDDKLLTRNCVETTTAIYRTC